MLLMIPANEATAVLRWMTLPEFRASLSGETWSWNRLGFIQCEIGAFVETFLLIERFVISSLPLFIPPFLFLPGPKIG